MDGQDNQNPTVPAVDPVAPTPTPAGGAWTPPVEEPSAPAVPEVPAGEPAPAGDVPAAPVEPEAPAVDQGGQSGGQV